MQLVQYHCGGHIAATFHSGRRKEWGDGAPFQKFLYFLVLSLFLQLFVGCCWDVGSQCGKLSWLRICWGLRDCVHQSGGLHWPNCVDLGPRELGLWDSREHPGCHKFHPHGEPVPCAPLVGHPLRRRSEVRNHLYSCFWRSWSTNKENHFFPRWQAGLLLWSRGPQGKYWALF